MRQAAQSFAQSNVAQVVASNFICSSRHIVRKRLGRHFVDKSLASDSARLI